MSVSTICDKHSRLTDRFPKRVHAAPDNFLDFNFLKSPPQKFTNHGGIYGGH